MSYSEFLDIEVRHDSFETDVKVLLENIRPKWNLDKIKVKKQTGGLSNVLFAIWNVEESGEKFQRGADVLLVRLYGEMLIDRSREMENMAALSKFNLSANVWARFGNGCCYEYIHGDVLSENSILLEGNNDLIIREFAKLHSVNLNIHRDQKPFIFSKALEFAYNMPDQLKDPERNSLYLSKMPSKLRCIEEIEFMRVEIEKLNCPVSFCHNDLIPLNIIRSFNRDRVHFIDFEYADYNYVPFDIGNHFCEYAGVDPINYEKCPDNKFKLAWLRQYLEEVRKIQINNKNAHNGHGAIINGSHGNGNCHEKELIEITEEEVNRWLDMVNKCMLVSHLFYIAWGMWQEQKTMIEYDYLEYCITRWNEYLRLKKKRFPSN